MTVSVLNEMTVGEVLLYLELAEEYNRMWYVDKLNFRVENGVILSDE